VAFVLVGHALGLGSKLLAFAQSGALSALVHVCAWNVAVILLDLALTLRFRRAAAAAGC
jgi:hypothetical protein